MLINKKVTTRKSLVLKSCSILYFHSEYYIRVIEILDFYFPHVYILVKNHCAGKLYEMFVIRRNNLDCKFIRDYAVRCQLLSEKVQSQ